LRIRQCAKFPVVFLTRRVPKLQIDLLIIHKDICRIIVENRGDVLDWEGIRRIAQQQTGLSDCPVTNHNTLDVPHASEMAASEINHHFLQKSVMFSIFCQIAFLAEFSWLFLMRTSRLPVFQMISGRHRSSAARRRFRKLSTPSRKPVHIEIERNFSIHEPIELQFSPLSPKENS
jgi:hypothetical protein